ncbi:MAG: aminopeptidase [Promethearchaeota archaeon]|jgi:aminopeptidase
MSSKFEQKLEKYADVILKIGLNFQPKQRLLIGGPTSGYDGVPFEAAPLVRLITKKAYQMGARLVDVIWADDQLRLLRFLHGPRRSLKEVPKWRIDARYNTSQSGDAHINITYPNPDLLKDVDPSLILKFQLHLNRHLDPVIKLVTQYSSNWLAISAPNKAWADKIFPDLPSEERIQKLWEVIFKICRVDEDNPISAWEAHIEILQKRCDYLNQKQYRALKLTSPETDLTIGLPKDHVWHGGSVKSQNEIDFTPNLPTEEIFTIPHKDRVEGVVKTTKPVFYQGQVVEECMFTFSKGRIIEAKAKVGEDAILKTIEIDEGARRLGEIALVPHSSPISKTGLLFYNMLIDENASNHIAIGQAFQNSLRNGKELTDEEFITAGGNNSIIHIDFMIGSGEMNVDGILENGTAEPVMKNGEWTFEV